MKIYQKILGLLALLLMISPAYADIGTISAAAQQAGDLSRQALVAIFGDVVNNPLSGSGSSSTILSSLFAVANPVFLVIGGIAVAFFFFKKATQVAHDGSIYSNNQHTVWGPLRMVFGFMALVPTANGWSLSQLIMLWAASVMGVGAANLTTNAAVTALQNGTSMVAQPAVPQATDLAKQLFLINLCRYAINNDLQNAAQYNALLPENSTIQPKPLQNGFILRNTDYVCGGATIPTSSTVSTGTFGSSITGIQQITTDYSSVYNAQIQALNALQSTMDTDASNFVSAVQARIATDPSTPMPDVVAEINGAASTYESSVQAAIAGSTGQISQLSSTIANNLQTNGWWNLGAWYQTFATANTNLSSAVQSFASTFGQSGDKPEETDLYSNALAAFKTQYNIANSSASAPIGSTAISGDGQAAAPQGSNSSQVIGKAYQAPGQHFVNWVVQSSTSTTGQINPVIQMKNLGDNVIVLGQGVLVAYAGLNYGEGTAKGSLIGEAADLATGSVSGASQVFDAVKPFITFSIFALFAIGATLSIYIPMIPFLTWFLGGCVNWLGVVAEGVIAAPLWALSILFSDGEGMGNRATHGWIFLLNLMVRPMLMTLGFFTAGGIIVAAGSFLNQIFGTALANAQYNSLTGVISIIGYIVLYCSACLNLVHTCFNLILIIPDQVIAWIGGAASANLGKEGNGNHQQAIVALGQKIEALPGVGKNREAENAGNGKPKNGATGG